jgi:hypothetical protein
VRVQGMIGRHGHRGAPPRPLSSTIQQLDLPHRRLTQRDRTFSLRETPAAISYVSERSTQGKTVITL